MRSGGIGNSDEESIKTSMDTNFVKLKFLHNFHDFDTYKMNKVKTLSSWIK